MNNYQDLFDSQKQHFNLGRTREIKIRIDAIRALGSELEKHQKDLEEAIYLDLQKPAFELFTTEIANVLHEIRWISSRLHRWTRPINVLTNVVNLPGSSRIIIEPYGNALIIGTWNYPFLLNLKPAVTALAAGNTVIIKPSEHAPHSSRMIANVVAASLPPELCAVVEGGVPEVTELLKLPFDKLFFTGSTGVGRLVMKSAAESLTSVTLELGGKSPAIVLPDAALTVTARRIVWGKFLNAGQTCIAPDYILVHESISESLINNLRKQIAMMFGDEPAKSGDFGRIVDKRHFNRLVSFINSEKSVIGGQHDENDLYISPTVLFPVSLSDPVMQEEIFGPILPIISFQDLDEAIRLVKSLPKSLALYVFSESKKYQDKVISEISFGGGCVNDAVMHIANPSLPFGGVGPSGMGRYHGKAGILEFSNQKSVMKKATWVDPFVRYPPFTGFKEKILRKLL